MVLNIFNEKLINLLSKFGATFLPKNKYTFPLKMISSEMPVGIRYKAGVSAQLKSAVLLAGLNSYGNTIIEEQIISRDHTENLLMKNIQSIKITKNKKKKIRKCSESVRSAPQKPDSVEDGQCPDCGSPATLYNYGIDAGGNEDHRTDCSNPKCDNYGITKKSTHLSAPRGSMSRGYM